MDNVHNCDSYINMPSLRIYSYQNYEHLNFYDSSLFPAKKGKPLLLKETIHSSKHCFG
jgi:hypothetical protein